MALPFAAILCTPPPGLSAADFLAEVQFLSNCPDQVRLLDDQLPVRLAAAFIRHPWVERVEKVEVAPGEVRVRLAYRTPVLAVPWSGADGPVRAVDRAGVVLPLAALTVGLPLYAGKVATPPGGAGVAWGDPRIEAAARTAAYLQPFQERPASRAPDSGGGGRLAHRTARPHPLGQSPGRERPASRTRRPGCSSYFIEVQQSNQSATLRHDRLRGVDAKP